MGTMMVVFVIQHDEKQVGGESRGGLSVQQQRSPLIQRLRDDAIDVRNDGFGDIPRCYNGWW